MIRPLALDRPKAGFSGCPQGDGLITPPDFVRMIGTFFAIAPVWSLLVVVFMLSRPLFRCVRNGWEPVLRQTFHLQTAVLSFINVIALRFAGAS